MEKKLKELKERLLEIDSIESAMSVLSWDQTTYMPAGGAVARGRQMATLSKLAHEKFVDPAIGKLLDDLQVYGESLPYEDDDAALLRVTRRDYERMVKVPSALLQKMTEQRAATYQAWVKARPKNDFAAITPYLEKTLDLSRQFADCFPGYDHIADPLISFFDYGMTANDIRAIFAELRGELVPLVQAIGENDPVDDSFIYQFYPKQKQLDFGIAVAESYGYDLTRGRQDLAHHPFSTSFSVGDVRITTRVNEKNLIDALFSTLHEVGHAMYEQGGNPAYDGTPLRGGASAGVHESQARLWENQIGRSHDFWSYYYPKLQEYFSEPLADVSLDAFYRAINKVTPSLIRVDADEVTYNLHVMVRFDLELAMLEGNLEIVDLPEAWNDRFEADLGIRPPSDMNGVLQDIHWYVGPIGGAFQNYTLGNIMSATFFDGARQAHPGIQDEIKDGEFSTLFGWLKENIYQYGKKFTPDELVERITGGPLTIEPYMRYLRTKFGELYDIG